MDEEQTNQAPGEGHNSEMSEHEKAQFIKTTCAQLDELEAERKAVSEKIKKLKHTNIKGKLGMKIADFNFARGLYGIDGDDRAEFLSTIKTTFDALGAGDQLDFVAAMERAHGAGGADPDADNPGVGSQPEAA
jgi:hypothetical protein